MLVLARVQPKSRKVILVLSQEMGSARSGLGFSWDFLPSADFAVELDDVHQSLPLEPPRQPAVPDPELLARGAAAASPAEPDDEAELAAAIALSLGQQPEAMEADDDEAELAAAIALSMEEQPAKRPKAKPDKAELQALVRKRFTELVAQGMTPNDAAAKALQEVQREFA